MNFVVVKDSGGKRRWLLVASNGQTVASSGESCSSWASAQRAAESVKARTATATVPSS